MAVVTDELIERFMSFANGFRHGYVKQWKAVGILSEVAIPELLEPDDIPGHVKNCLKMEGFRDTDCEAISDWIIRHHPRFASEGVT